ncbi:Protein of unknown function [Gryllus bimaculatus]|nr:Protein of unknown function [Gryllus bimaculatus]
MNFFFYYFKLAFLFQNYLWGGAYSSVSSLKKSFLNPVLWRGRSIQEPARIPRSSEGRERSDGGGGGRRPSIASGGRLRSAAPCGDTHEAPDGHTWLLKRRSKAEHEAKGHCQGSRSPPTTAQRGSGSD